MPRRASTRELRGNCLRPAEVAVASDMSAHVALPPNAARNVMLNRSRKVQRKVSLQARRDMWESSVVSGALNASMQHLVDVSRRRRQQLAPGAEREAERPAPVSASVGSVRLSPPQPSPARAGALSHRAVSGSAQIAPWSRQRSPWRSNIGDGGRPSGRHVSGMLLLEVNPPPIFSAHVG